MNTSVLLFFNDKQDWIDRLALKGDWSGHMHNDYSESDEDLQVHFFTAAKLTFKHPFLSQESQAKIEKGKKKEGKLSKFAGKLMGKGSKKGSKRFSTCLECGCAALPYLHLSVLQRSHRHVAKEVKWQQYPHGVRVTRLFTNSPSTV